MPFQNLLAEPDVLSALKTAFDEAWTAIELSVDPLAQAKDREYLGSIIVGLWKMGETDMLAAKAVIKFRETPRNCISMPTSEKSRSSE
ncbi:hypothetical protein [Bosea sp. PAMC 26642]|uniref:hypothetical protein n=1 Tax=Bosea sp. (strain PAMC 26642) TaxID=1792307 RepID=UPI00077012E1|nr:hypothetical protein [Bosea sp. PAMC 26642]AMJ61082.1 hypothetical protein AXW83_12985 [Bosea sp. PAMC 26642]